MDIFCVRFKEIKKSKNVTYPQIAARLGVGVRAVKFYASGDAKPDYYGLVALADYLEVSLDYLTGRSDTPDIK